MFLSGAKADPFLGLHLLKDLGALSGLYRRIGKSNMYSRGFDFG